MNKAFDYNGTIVSQSKPVQKLRTIKRTIHINSGDRDPLQYPTNGDFIVYLPNSYENVVAVRVKGAEFPPLLTGSTGSYYVHNSGSTGPTFSTDANLNYTGIYSIYLDIDNLNKSDETGSVTSVNHVMAPCQKGLTLSNCSIPINSSTLKTFTKYSPQSGSELRSTYTENVFAKFQLPATTTEPLLYNESSSIHNESYYQPPLSRLDRLHLRLRTHTQKGNGISASGVTGVPGFIYTSGGNSTAKLEYGISLEFEMLGNGFDDYSSLESRVSDRSGGGFWGSL